MLRVLVAVLACLACCLGSARAQQSTVTALQSHAADQVVAKQISPDKAAPLLLQADDLVYDNRNNRVIARGNVEIYYNDNVLLADEIVYDKSANTLSAVGNVRLEGLGRVGCQRGTVDIEQRFSRRLHPLASRPHAG